jgi:hypothetical protein
MKGFKVYYGQETIKAAVSDGMITFNLFNNNQMCLPGKFMQHVLGILFI